MASSAVCALLMAPYTAQVANAADFTLPSGHTVIDGTASVSSNPVIGDMQVNQSSDRAIINWNSFNIGADARVQFFQPSSSSLAVNRVTGGALSPTQILGELSANGRVMVLDPNGVMFGPGSVVDVAGIVASSGDVNDLEVMSGSPLLTLSNFGTGAVENHGTITAQDFGLVSFVAPTVKNSGVINAQFGKVELAAGNETAIVDLYGDGLIALAFTGNTDPLLAENTGAINANGGKVALSAAEASDIVDQVVNLDGVVNATTASLVNGQIVLSAKNVNVKSTANVTTDDAIFNAQIIDLDATINGPVVGGAGVVNVLSDAAKINQALDVVAAGGEIFVAPGNYIESVVIDVEGVSLFGAMQGLHGVDFSRGIGETVIIPNSPGILVTADNVTVDGVMITNADNGIEAVGVNNLSLLNSLIFDSTDNGIYLSNVTDSYVEGNYIFRTGYDGIYVQGGSNVSLSLNSILEAGLDFLIPNERGNGILIDHSLNANLVENITSLTYWDGIKAIFSDNISITENATSSVTRAGVSVENSANAIIQDNVFENSGMVGVWSENNDNVDISSNFINNAGSYFGIFHNLGDNAQIVGNTVTSADIYGAFIRESNGVSFAGNDISNTGSDGVYVLDSASIDISENLISNSGLLGIPDEKGNGILLENTHGSTITFNQISDSLWDAVKAVFSDNLNVSNNIMQDITRSGVSVENSSSPVISGNTMFNMGMVGVWSEKNPNAQIIGNSADDVGQFFGIFHNLGDNVLISGNQIGAADIYGLYVLDSLGVTIDGNTFLNSGISGMYLKDTSGTNIVSNNIVSDFTGAGLRIESGTGLLPFSGLVVQNTIGNETASGQYGIYSDAGAESFTRIEDNLISNDPLNVNGLIYGIYGVSGEIDLSTGTGNTIENTNIGLAFHPNPTVLTPTVAVALVAPTESLILTGDTIGQTHFIDQTELFVDLGEGAFFPSGAPTLLDGMNATYTLGATTIDPALSGSVTPAEYATLEAMINHFIDSPDRGLFFFNVVTPPVPGPIPFLFGVEQSDIFNNEFQTPQFGRERGGRITITGLPFVGGLPHNNNAGRSPVFNFNNISPAAGGDNTPSTMSEISPAAGREGLENQATNNAPCWADANAALGQGSVVTYDLGNDASDLLNDVASCGAGQSI